MQRHLKITGIRYHQHLGRLIRDPEALELFPQLVYRLRSIAAERRAETDARLLNTDS
ncbi:DUF3263 domain-containing protein [Herbiconiux sp. VKM Ac-2851]|uniref:DUF3263 domain-containing protein n=1 Tax=Herbiconiux sp. VKM Ac-2851 TaxID=2739025 RepID=UPI00156777D0|nr:DUF3263 domain-containing protein [Herbiconiux sp. VKM Ac-2851]